MKINSTNERTLQLFIISVCLIIPIDGQDNKDVKSALPFNKYYEVNRKVLLQDIQKELQENRTKGEAPQSA